jgi:hypothetical protein
MLGCVAAVIAIVSPSQLKPAVSQRIEISFMSHARSWAWLAVIGIVGYVVARALPDVARYLRIRRM